MKPPPFDYTAPETLEEALALLAEHGDDALPIAGGQSLVPMLALRVSRPGFVVDLNRIRELAEIDVFGATLRVGAMTRQAEVIKSKAVAGSLPELADANRLVGHFQTRNRGTIGGSISLGEPAAENPAFALALDAELELRSSRGARTVLASDFYMGPYFTARRDDELLTRISYTRPPGARIAIREIARRTGDFALSGIVACIAIDDGRITTARLGWFGMGGTPLRAPSAEAALTGAAIADLDLAAVADLALGDTEPPDDGHATADYRRHAGRILFERVTRACLQEKAPDERS